MTIDYNETLQKALLSIRKLKQLLKNKHHEPIAIIGLSCRFPQAQTKEQYWDLLCQGKNTITAIPSERWELLKGSHEAALRLQDYPYWGSFLPKIAEFDAAFFGITPREAMRMDPQHRLFLEVAYEAFEDAGLAVEKLAGSNTGVFASVYANALGYLQEIDTDLDALYIPTGNATSIAANRLSYLFDLRGPSMVLDTACSSTLVATHLACLHLQNQLCDVALVGGANINIIPSVNSLLRRANMLSPDGQCKTFDASANGYVQGEGIGSIVLKSLSKALRDNDRIYAVIEACVVNQDGRTNGLTAPNGLAQEKLLQAAYASANINPNRVAYIECHGTGTVLGDPIELQALGAVIGKNRRADQPCYIGSVKTNIGHLEPAAGMASLIKVALALKNSQIPPHLNYSTPNPHYDINEHHLKIPQVLEPLPQYEALRVAGVSGFGFGGTNAHIVLREVTTQEKPVESVNNSDHAELFTLSAKDHEALLAGLKAWHTLLEKNPLMELSAICYNLHVRRSHFSHRVAIVASSTQELTLAVRQALDLSLHNSVNIFWSIEKKPTPQSKNLSLQDVNLLARSYADQESINWFELEASRLFPLIDMPLYAWQHKVYWPKLASFDQREESVDSYPFKAKQIISPLDALQFEFSFDLKFIPEISDTNNILHAGFYLEMIAVAADKYFHKQTFTVMDFSFNLPIIVPKENGVTVQLVITPIENEYLFEFYSNTFSQPDWKKHAAGKLVFEEHAVTTIDPSIINKKKNIPSQDEATFYNKIESMMMPSQGTIRWVHQYWAHDKEIVCDFRQPQPNEENSNLALKFHYGVIDACIQSLFLLLPADILQPYVTTKISKLVVYGNAGKTLRLSSTVNDLSPQGEKFVGSWTLFNEDGAILIECEDIQMTQLGQKVNIDQVSNESHAIDLGSIPERDREQYLTDFLIKQTATIFSMPTEQVDIHVSLRDLGIDSLMGLVLIQAIETGLGVTYSLPQILQGITLADIVEFVMGSLSKKVVTASFKPVTPWIMYRKHLPAPKARLFCLPYGGGGASIYRDWQAEFSEEIEVCPIQLPGRENRLKEPPITSLQHLVDEIIVNIESELTLPFAFFGHSFGSLISFELTRQLRKRHLPMPVHFFASAYPDPRLRSHSLDNMLAELKRMNIDLFAKNAITQLNTEQLDKLADMFLRLGFIDASHVSVKHEIMKLMLPIFIADIGIVRSYQYSEEPPFDLPMTVFVGMQDTWVLPEDHLGWCDLTTQNCDLFELDGGHLFIRDELLRIKVEKKIIADLLGALACKPASRLQYGEPRLQL